MNIQKAFGNIRETSVLKRVSFGQIIRWTRCFLVHCLLCFCLLFPFVCAVSLQPLLWSWQARGEGSSQPQLLAQQRSCHHCSPSGGKRHVSLYNYLILACSSRFCCLLRHKKFGPPCQYCVLTLLVNAGIASLLSFPGHMLSHWMSFPDLLVASFFFHVI